MCEQSMSLFHIKQQRQRFFLVAVRFGIINVVTINLILYHPVSTGQKKTGKCLKEMRKTSQILVGKKKTTTTMITYCN